MIEIFLLGGGNPTFLIPRQEFPHAALSFLAEREAQDEPGRFQGEVFLLGLDESGGNL
jgi:hypothetical protein